MLRKCFAWIFILGIVFSFTILTADFNTADAKKYKKSKRYYKKNGKNKKDITTAKIETGLDFLVGDKFKLIYKKNVGLITNHTAIDKKGKNIVDLMNNSPRVNLKKIFTPEHGLYGKNKEKYESQMHDKFGVMVYSLYRDEKFEPEKEWLYGLDVLVFDLQFLGTRYDTSLASLVYMMKAAAKERVPVIVLDRPNVFDTMRIEGAIPNKRETNHITSIYPIPTIPGMTIGELAYYFNKEFNIDCNLYVVKMEKYERTMEFKDTGFIWRSPTPNLNSIEDTKLFAGIGFLENTNISVGKGTKGLYRYFGAPWVDKYRLDKQLGNFSIDGVTIKKMIFKPQSGIYNGQLCYGFSIDIKDYKKLNYMKLGLSIMKFFYDNYNENYNISNCKNMIGDHLIEEHLASVNSVDEILNVWNEFILKFKEKRKDYLLYVDPEEEAKKFKKAQEEETMFIQDLSRYE